MEYKLNEIITFSKGFAFKSKDYTEVGIDLVKVSDFTDNSIDIQKTKKLPKEFTNKYTKYKLSTSDILISTVGSWPSNPNSVVGKIVRVPKLNHLALLNQNIAKINLDSLDISYDYLYYLLRTEKFKNYIIGTAQGSANQASITLKDIGDFRHDFPDIDIQKKISNILMNMDSKIKINQKIIANLEELSQTLFKRWFVDFEFPDENGNPYKSSGGEMVDSELGEIPINWNLVKLGSIANIRTGYAFKSTEYIEQIQLPVLRTLNISKSNLLVTMNDIKFVPYQYLYMDKYQKYNLELFDTLLVTVGGSIGNLGLVTENNLPSLQNQNMWRFRSIKSNISNTLIYQLILYVNSLVYNQTSGSAREFYTKKTFENFNLLLPKLDSYLYESINKYLENFGKKISDLNVEIEKLTQLRDTLLPKLMSGEIEIPDHIEVNEDELSI